MNLQMIRLIPIEKNELRPFMLLAFKDDPDLVEKYHIKAPGKLDDLVDDTLKNIVDYGDAIGARYFKVMFVNVPIGFTVTFERPKRTLLSFGINIQFRKKNILMEWLRRVYEVFDNDDFIVHLYLRNTRAIAFFIKNGFNQSKTQDNYISLWQY